jgi:hypothetical protein
MLSNMPSTNEEDQAIIELPETTYAARSSLQVRIAERTILQDQLKVATKYWDTLLLTGLMQGGVPVDPMAVVLK